MGFFSWKTSDTNRSISNIASIRGTFPVYVLIPKEFQKEYGTYIEEKNYEGYGVFGNEDMYSLVAKWNVPEQCKKDGKLLDNDDLRMIGIEIACYDEKNAKLKYPIKIVEDKNLKYEEVAPSKNAPDQGFFYAVSEEKVINEETIDDIKDEISGNLQEAVKDIVLNILENVYPRILESNQFTTEHLENISSSISNSNEINDHIDKLICDEIKYFEEENLIEDEEESI